MKRLASTLFMLLWIGMVTGQVMPDSLLGNGRKAYQEGNYGLAITRYRQYLAKAEDQGNELAAVDAIRWIGDALRASGEKEVARDQLLQGMKRAQAIGDSMGLGRIHDRLAAVYYEMGEFQKAEAEANAAMALAQANGEQAIVSSSLNILGATYRSTGAIEKSLDALSQSIAIQRAMGDTSDVPGALNNIANALTHAKRYDEAIDTATKSYTMATNLKIPAYQQYAAHILNQAYFASGNYKLAYEWLEIHSEISNFLRDDAKGKEVAKLMAEMKTTQQEQENKRLSAENALQLQTISSQRNKALAFAMIGLLVLLIAIGLGLVTRRQRRTNAALKEKNQRIEQQTNLISEINVELERNAQEREAQKARLEEINRVKDQLFFTISHDLRSPLTSIQGMLQLMEKGLLEEEEQKRIAISLKNRVDNTKILLDNILNWSRSQMEGFNIQPEPIDLHEIVELEAQLMLPAAAQKGLEIQNSVPPETLALGDRDMIALVLRNLISNALKFTEPGGSVHIHSKATAQELHVAVSDTGIGIPSAFAKKLFGEQSVSTAGTNQEKGSGIGLRLCKEFLVKNHGRIWYEANASQGSTFWIALPNVVGAVVSK